MIGITKKTCSHSPACDDDCCRCEEYDKEMLENEIYQARTLLEKNGYIVTKYEKKD